MLVAAGLVEVQRCIDMRDVKGDKPDLLVLVDEPVALGCLHTEGWIRAAIQPLPEHGFCGDVPDQLVSKITAPKLGPCVILVLPPRKSDQIPSVETNRELTASGGPSSAC